MGMTDQTGNEIDEFVTETLRNNLLGLPLDLAAINITRGREAGVPPLNEFRRQLFTRTRDSSLRPYSSWSDFGLNLKHPYSLVNFIAAYGTHPSITGGLAHRRAAAELLVEWRYAAPPATGAAFLDGTGGWANRPSGLEQVDLWVGGLAESTRLFGGMLGSTFSYVFEQQMLKLQDGDRLYYLARTRRSEPAERDRGQLVRRDDHAQHRRHGAEGRRVRDRRLRVRDRQPRHLRPDRQ